MKQLDTKLMHPAEQITVIIGRIYRSGMTTTSGGNGRQWRHVDYPECD